MSERILLHLDAFELMAWHWRKGLLALEAVFPTGAEGLAGFDAWLGRRKSRLFSLLVDLTDEGFVTETIPFVGGRDRQALIRRKLGQTFQASPFVLCRSLGRDKEGRRDEQVLLLGLPREEFFRPFLTTLRKHRAPVTGLFTGALMADTLAGRLAPPFPRFLLVNIGHAGIRVSFFDAGRLRFSHLKPGSFTDPESMASACHAEACQLNEHLLGQRLIGRNAGLPCVIVAHPDHDRVFAAHCTNTPELEFMTLDLRATSGRLGLRTPVEDSNADSLWLHLLATRPPAEQFAPYPERHFHALWRLRFALQGGAATLCAAALLHAGMDLRNGQDLKAETAIRRKEALVLQSLYQARMARLPPLPMQAERLHTLAERYALLEGHSPLPQSLFRILGRALDRFPEIELEHLDWALEAAVEPTARQAPSARGPTISPILTFRCRLPPERHEILEAFTAALREEPSVSVDVISRQPQGGQILQGSSDEDSAAFETVEMRMGRTS